MTTFAYLGAFRRANAHDAVALSAKLAGYDRSGFDITGFSVLEGRILGEYEVFVLVRRRCWYRLPIRELFTWW